MIVTLDISHIPITAPNIDIGSYYYKNDFFSFTSRCSGLSMQILGL